MVHPVHVRCHYQKPQHPVNAQGDKEVAVIEHGGAVEENFKKDRRERRCAQDEDGTGGCEQLPQGKNQKDSHKKGRSKDRFVFRHICCHGIRSRHIVPLFR